MRKKSLPMLAGCLMMGGLITACDKKSNPSDGLPPVAKITETGNLDLVKVDKPEQFPLAAGERVEAAGQLQVTGSVNPDIAREVPVISLASGRVVEIKTRLDDYVKKGQLLLKVQSPDIPNAFDVYLKCVNDEQLANKAYVRAKDLYAHGGISLSMLEQAEDSEKDAQADLTAAEEQLDTLGVDKLNDRTPVDQFDITGLFGFSEDLKPLDDIRQVALTARPDLQTFDQAKTNHQLAVANGSTDPTFGAWYTYNPSFYNPYAHQTLGLSVSIPLRIFDRNQGEKQRTLIDINRNQQLTDATRAQVFSDVDSSYEQVRSNIALLLPYRDKYKDQATRVRDTVSYMYQRGGASLMDFLNAQSDYRVVQLAYLQLIGSYLTVASQLNLAVGREVIP